MELKASPRRGRLNNLEEVKELNAARRVCFVVKPNTQTPILSVHNVEEAGAEEKGVVEIVGGAPQTSKQESKGVEIVEKDGGEVGNGVEKGVGSQTGEGFLREVEGDVGDRRFHNPCLW